MTDWPGALEEWAGWCRAAGHSEATIYLRGYVIRQFAAHVGSSDPFTVTLGDCARFVGRPGIAVQTRRTARATLRSFFAWALECGYLDVSPAQRLPTIREPATAPRPTSDELFTNAVKTADDRTRIMLLLGAYAGLRRSEIAGLRWDDRNGDVLRVRGKGGKIRVVPLHPVLGRELDGWRWRLNQPESPWVFPGRFGGPLSGDVVGRHVRRALGGQTGAHSLRHRFAMRGYAATHDLLALQQLLGHSDPSTTTRYARANTDALMATVMGAGAERGVS